MSFELISDFNLSDLDNSKYIKLKKAKFKQQNIIREWDLIEVHNSVATLLFDDINDEFILVKQFRPPVYLQNRDGFTYELCAGIVDKPKPLIEIAKEEILEETGYDVNINNIQKITSFYTSVGFAGSKQELFFAVVNDFLKVNEGGGNLDEYELIEVVKLKKERAKEFMFDENIAKTPGLMFAFMWFFENEKELIKK
ncbi:MAG: NUDIX hydrolase [Campylobacterales bacterium]|nr:NUDIX hydrolase [Campylobacterales bacterium]